MKSLAFGAAHLGLSELLTCRLDRIRTCTTSTIVLASQSPSIRLISELRKSSLNMADVAGMSRERNTRLVAVNIY